MEEWRGRAMVGEKQRGRTVVDGRQCTQPALMRLEVRAKEIVGAMVSNRGKPKSTLVNSKLPSMGVGCQGRSDRCSKRRRRRYGLPPCPCFHHQWRRCRLEVSETK